MLLFSLELVNVVSDVHQDLAAKGIESNCVSVTLAIPNLNFVLCFRFLGSAVASLGGAVASSGGGGGTEWWLRETF